MNIKKIYNDFINIIDEPKNKIILKKEIVNTNKITNSIPGEFFQQNTQLPNISSPKNINILEQNNIHNKQINECNCFTSISDSQNSQDKKNIQNIQNIQNK